MPAIRDYSQNYSSSSTLATVCAQPDTLENDLLVALVSCDTAAASQYWVGGEAATSVQYDDGGVFTNYTTQFNALATSWYMVSATPAAVNDACYFGHTSVFNGVSVLVATAPSMVITWTWEYYNGATWVTLTTLSNGIIPTMTAGVHALSFNPPTDWASVAVNAVTAYYIRARISSYTSVTTRPIFNQGYVGKWNQLFQITSGTTAHHSILYKIAGATEPAEYGMNDQLTTSDTRNALIASVKDIDPLIPFSHTTVAAMSYSETNRDTDMALYAGSVVGVAQSFTSPATAYRLASCKFYLKKVGSPTGNITVTLYTQTAGVKPTTPTLAISATYNIANLTTSYQLIEFTFPLMMQYWMAASTVYCIGLEYSDGDASNYLHVGYDASAPSAAGNGSTLTGVTWTAQTYDFCFYAYYFDFTTSTSTTVRTVLPTMTTVRNNSLLLWSMADESASVPSIIEGPCHLLAAKDGASHSDAISWGFQKTLGTTANNVYATRLLTSSLVNTLSVCAINPPSTGATVIPPYCPSDSSVYISPMTGAAYNTDSAPVNTVTSNFGSTLNGVTLSSGGTTYTLADTGVNSYHAMNNVLGLSTSNVWSGNVTVIASRNLAAKNVLFHIQPATPVAIQTTDSVALDGTMGVAIGFASTANTHYKTWHVGGANSSWGIQRHAPVIINTDYAVAVASDGGLLQNTGTLVPTAVVNIGFFVSCKVAAASWLMGSVWVMDTVVIAGGNAAAPLDISGIVAAGADAHERRNIIKQGSSQFMILGPTQIGDGGTNSVYLKLESTALEFPQQYNKAAKNVGYCSVDNVCGLKYYAGASDTIIHKNSIVSSSSRYHWGFHASYSTSCTPDFSGLAVIGAGTITLNKAVTVTGLTINNYSTLDMTGLTLTYSTIKRCPVGNASATLTSTSNMDYNNIDVSLVTAGNYWCTVTNFPDIFTYCTFTGGGGHAIRITTPGTYNFVGNVFNGFGANGSTGAAILNESGGLVTINISGGGNTPSYKNVASATTSIVNSVTVKVTALDVDTSAAVVGARVYLTAAAGGDLSVGTVILNDLTNASGVLQTTSFAFTNNQPVTGRVRRASTGTFYKTSQLTGTITSAGLDTTTFMIKDQ